MAAISWNLQQLGPNFALHSGTSEDTCLQNIIVTFANLRALGRGQRFMCTFWSLHWQLQTNQTHIVSIFNMGPNKISFSARKTPRRVLRWTWLTSVTLKMCQGDQYTIPDRCPMRGNNTPNFVILAHVFLELSRQRCLYDDIQSLPLWPWKWVKVTHIKSQAGFPWEVPTR